MVAGATCTRHAATPLTTARATVAPAARHGFVGVIAARFTAGVPSNGIGYTGYADDIKIDAIENK
jgi:hypothetical protein